MWVLAVFDTKAKTVEVRGPWDEWEIADGARKAWPEMAKARGDKRKVILSVVGIQPMVYFRPSE